MILDTAEKTEKAWNNITSRINVTQKTMLVNIINPDGTSSKRSETKTIGKDNFPNTNLLRTQSNSVTLFS